MKEANDVHKPIRTAIRAWLCAAALGLLLVSPGASAAVGRSEFQAFMDLSTGTGKHTVGFGPGGMPLATSGVPGPTAVGNMNIVSFAGPFEPGPAAGGTAKLPLPGGKSIPLAVKQPIDKRAAAAAIGKFARAFGGPILAGIALYELLDALHLVPSWDSDAKENKFLEEYQVLRWRYSGQNASVPDFESSSAACAHYGIGRGNMYLFLVDSPTQARCYFDGGSTIVQATEGETMQRNLTDEELTDRIAAMSGWPTTASQSLAGALKAGQLIDLMGPPDVQLPNGGTVYNTEGNVVKSIRPGENGDTIETETATMYVATKTPDGKIEVKEKQTTTERQRNAQGVVTREEVKTQEKKAENEKCTESSTNMDCAQLDTPEGKIPKSSVTISYTAENPFGDGSCPANVTSNVGTLGKSITVWDWQKTCAMALPLRALVIALASFAAFLILMPVRVET